MQRAPRSARHGGLVLLLSLLPVGSVLFGQPVITTLDGPSDRSGLGVGDVVVGIGERDVSTLQDLMTAVVELSPGEDVALRVARGESVFVQTVTATAWRGGVTLGASVSRKVGDDILAGSWPVASLDRAGCNEWAHVRYGAADSPLDSVENIEDVSQCMKENLALMDSPLPTLWCDNVFKIHCSGIDVLTDIGEQQIEICSDALRSQLRGEPEQYDGWKSCAEDRIFDMYAVGGERATEETCRRVFFEECGTDLGTLSQLTERQQQLTACCTGARADCPMLDPSLGPAPCSKGPCVDLQTNDWISCLDLD